MRSDRPIIAPAKPFASAGCVTSGVKSTRIGSKSESSTRPLARYVVISRVPASGCAVQNVPEWPIAGMTISLPLGREGRSSFVAFCGGVAKSSSPPTSSVSTFDVRTRLVLARRRARPGVDELPAEPVEIGAGVAEDRPAIAGREVALRRPVVARGDGRHLAPDERLRECQLGEQRLEPEAAGVAVVRRDPGVERHRSRERSCCRLLRGLEEPVERRNADLPLVDRQEPPALREVPVDALDRPGQVVGPTTAGLVLGAQGRVAADLLVRRPPVPDEVAGRVHRDQDRPVDAPRVAPGVDHRVAGARRSR